MENTAICVSSKTTNQKLSKVLIKKYDELSLMDLNFVKALSKNLDITLLYYYFLWAHVFI